MEFLQGRGRAAPPPKKKQNKKKQGKNNNKYVALKHIYRNQTFGIIFEVGMITGDLERKRKIQVVTPY